MGEQPFDVKDVLHREFGKALSCEERALFFSSKAAAYSSSHPKPPLGKNPDIDTLFRETRTAYFNAWDMLLTRIDDVTKEYEKLVRFFKKLRYLGICIPDRDYNFTIQSRRVVKSRFDDLMLLLDGLPKPNEENIESIIREYTRIWDGLYNICQLFMEEISFLCKRIEGLQGMLNVVKGWALTFFTLLISATLAIAAIVVNIFKDRLFPKTTPSPKIAEIIHRLDRLISHETVLTGKIDSVPSELDALKTQIANSEMAIKEQAEEIAKDASASLRAEISILNNQASRIEAAIAANTAQLPHETREMRARIETLSLAIAKLEVAIAKKEVPQVNVTAPRQEPVKNLNIFSIQGKK